MQYISAISICNFFTHNSGGSSISLNSVANSRWVAKTETLLPKNRIKYRT